jgi:pimeloyl-ACP methyl ester carboxylesterase
MRCWMAAPLVFAIAGVLGVPGAVVPRASAQAKADPPVEETFLTADGLQLRGLFHKSTKDPATAPVVILLYPPGKDKDKERDMNTGDWVGLANRLAGEGYHVFRFDWRGHGKKGTDIKDTNKFWGNPYTGAWNSRYITGAKKAQKTDLYLKDVKDMVRYSPTLLLDLAAVRAHLDSKNDSGELNTSSIYLVGAESAATIGLAWMGTEWNRPGFAPTPNQLIFPAPRYEYVPQPLNGGIVTPAGDDISGAVWLSPSHPQHVSESVIKGWISRQAPKLRDNTHMMFMYAEKDTRAKRESEFFFNEVLVGKGNPRLGLNPLNEKYLHKIAGAGQLSGAALLGNDKMLKTESTIVEFLSAIQKERAKLTRKQRNFTSPWFIRLDQFGFAG